MCVQHLEALFAELCAQLQEANGLEQKAGKRSKSKTDAGAGAAAAAATAAPAPAPAAAAPAPPAAAAKAQVLLNLLALLVQKCQYWHPYKETQVVLDAAPAHASPQQMRALI